MMLYLKNLHGCVHVEWRGVEWDNDAAFDELQHSFD